MRLRLLSSVLLLALLALLGCGAERERPRVLLLGLDGMDPDVIDLLMSEGKLPNFARLRQEGAYGRLLSERPMLSPIIWTTIATGKRPGRHGIGHFTAQSARTGQELPVTSDMRKVKALWNIASEHDRRVAIVGWWATWPPEEVNGVIVSDHTAYHFLFEDGFTGGASPDAPKTHPRELLERISPRLRRPSQVTHEELGRFANVDPQELSRPFAFTDELAHLRWVLATTRSYAEIGLDLWREERPALEMLYIEGTDSASHLFGHLFRVGPLAGELARQQERYGQTVEAMYVLADRILGEYMAAMDRATTLVVASDHGFDLGALQDDPSKTRDMRRVSERFHKIEGILYLYGKQIRKNVWLDRPSIVDVTPTVLALLGLPAADDMPGRVLEEALRGVEAPARVASYERPAGDRTVAGAKRDAETDEALLERLRSLGYVGGDAPGTDPGPAARSPMGDRNLAAIAFEEGRYEAAARLYARLAEQEPADPALRTSLAGALGALGRYDEARQELEAAIEANPLNPETHHNLAVIHERRGERDEAVSRYRTALRYGPKYEPSRRALLRLTGAAEVRAPAGEAERQALELAERAALSARRGDYAEASRLLDEAERIAPRFVLVHQYRSNVAYLMGDGDAGIAALEKALALEPDNALFRENLKLLKER